MKRSSVLPTALLLLTGFSLCAQTTNSVSGVFITAADFKSNKIAYAIGPEDKIQLNEFLDGKNISLTIKGKKIRLAKSAIFGLRTGNQNYRFFDNQAYKIIDTAGFMLYSREKLTPQTKGYAPSERYFYSTDASRPVLALTISNLNQSFLNQTAFRYSIENNFTSDAGLAAFDPIANQYKIKYLYFQQRHPNTNNSASAR